MPAPLAPYRKLIVAVLGAAGVAVAEGLVPDAVGGWLTVIVAFATALGVYQVENEPNYL